MDREGDKGQQVTGWSRPWGRSKKGGEGKPAEEACARQWRMKGAGHRGDLRREKPREKIGVI
uniref:Uncharacterized protein n=1 Tax=Phyllostachys edulis TaxID=38705 RepID=D3IVJ0_PHYED|nr:hypothetical protein [Phyllostachys edulis]